jgi:hypothetical protein
MSPIQTDVHENANPKQQQSRPRRLVTKNAHEAEKVGSQYREYSRNFDQGAIPKFDQDTSGEKRLAHRCDSCEAMLAHPPAQAAVF